MAKQIKTVARELGVDDSELLTTLQSKGVVKPTATVLSTVDPDIATAAWQESSSDVTPPAPTGRTRQRNSRKSITKAPRPTPGDKQIMTELNEQARELHRTSWVAKPDRVEKAGTNRIRYFIGETDYVMPATEFQGRIERKEGFEVRIPFEVKEAMADKLRSVSFKSTHCEVCGEELDDYQPEMAMVNEMIHNGGVLAAEGYRPPLQHSEHRREHYVYYRRAHLLCRLWENEYTNLIVEVSNSDDEIELDQLLLQSVNKVLREAQRKVPTTTEVDVLAALQAIRQYMREGSAR